MVNDNAPKGMAGRKKQFRGSAMFINAVILVAVCICVVPVVHIIALSLSGRAAVLAQKVTLWPVDIDFAAYRAVFNDINTINSLWFTIAVTFVYTVTAMFMTILLAYPLSKKRMPAIKWLMLFIIIPMYFSGGLIPEYLWIKQLNLINTPQVLILPILISTYNTIILRNFFTAIPESLEESAFLDGCNDWQILLKIVLPLSTAALATLSLFYAVDRWNRFTDVLYYINKPGMYTLQMRLYQIIYSSADSELSQMEGVQAAVLTETIKAAAIVFSTTPILIIYPLLQRYFVQGVMIGSIKE